MQEALEFYTSTKENLEDYKKCKSYILNYSVLFISNIQLCIRFLDKQRGVLISSPLLVQRDVSVRFVSKILYDHKGTRATVVKRYLTLSAV